MNNSFVFLSYSRSDSEIALKITRNIQDFGGNIWLDQLHISGGDRWDQAIEDALEKSTHLIVLLSPASIDSYNVMDKVSYALEEKKTLIPLLIENCKIPFRLRRLQYIDCEKDYELGIKKLVKLLGLSATESKASPPDPADKQPVQAAPKPAKAAKIIEKKPVPKKEKADSPKNLKTNDLSNAWRLYEDAKKLNKEDKFNQALKLLKEHAKICRSKSDKKSLRFNYGERIQSFRGKGQWGNILKCLEYQEKIDNEVEWNQQKYDEIFDKYNLIKEEKKDSQFTVNAQEDSDAKKLYINAKRLYGEVRYDGDDRLDQALELLKEHASICKSYDDKISLHINYDLQYAIYVWKSNWELVNKFLSDLMALEADIDIESKKYIEIWETNGLT